MRTSSRHRAAHRTNTPNVWKIVDLWILLAALVALASGFGARKEALP